MGGGLGARSAAHARGAELSGLGGAGTARVASGGAGRAELAGRPSLASVQAHLPVKDARGPLRLGAFHRVRWPAGRFATGPRRAPRSDEIADWPVAARRGSARLTRARAGPAVVTGTPPDTRGQGPREAPSEAETNAACLMNARSRYES